MKDNEISRRQFLKQSAAAAGGLAILGGSSFAMAEGDSTAKTVPPSERIRVAVIGCGGQGFAHTAALMNLKKSGYPVDIVAVCDVYKYHLEAAAFRTGAESYYDYRKVLERKDIDAITIACPDHWHAPMTIEAAQAGKDVYCEKPMTYWKNLSDTQDVVKTIARTKRVMQVGTQGMSKSIWSQVGDRIKAGAAGKLVHAQASDLRNGYINVYDPKYNDNLADPTKNLDWNMWLGPAKKRPWEPGRYFAFRSYLDYSGGCGTDFFPHILTPLVRTMGLRFPKRVSASGGQYILFDGREIPDIFTITIEYPGGPSVLLSASLITGDSFPMIIRGHDATITFDGPGAVIHGEKPEEIKTERGESMEEHFRDFLDCVKSRQKPRSNEQLGYYVMTALHMGVHSYLKGRAMDFDPVTEKARFV